MNALVIGGRGTLGRHVCNELTLRGHDATPVGRGDAWRDMTTDLVIDCAGASVALGLGHGWRGYPAVDVPVGLAAVELARRCDARLVYLGVQHGPELRRTAYVAAHERVAEAMRAVDGCIVRATGFFAALAQLLPVARKGWLVDVGSGQARTNPISERDLAKVVVDAAFHREREVAAGGPEVMTRAEMFAQIAAAAGRRVRFLRVPAWLARLGAPFVRALHPRIGQFAQFAIGLARYDNVAPALGTTRFADYLAIVGA